MDHFPTAFKPAILLSLVGLLAIASLSGCVAGDNRVAEAPLPIDVDTDGLMIRLDEELDACYQDRELDIDRNAAWQVLHGVLAYGKDFNITKNGKTQKAVDYLSAGGALNGWTLQPGREFDGRRGLVSVMEPGAKEGQGHQDQWLAILAQCDLPLEHKLMLDGEEFTVEDMVNQSKWDVARNPYNEYSWTLIALTHYLGTETEWEAADGKMWTIKDLVRVELDHDLDNSACGGTHRLIGLTMALNRHMKNGGELTGVWQETRDKIDNAILKAQEFQNPDGSFSNSFFAGPGQAVDIAENIGASGHTLEFLSLAMTEEQLQQPWMQRGAAHLCDVLTTTRKAPVECGSLYHAVHGLVLYRERVYGRRDFSTAEATTLTQTTNL